jgi:hypothetical protein
MIDPTAFCVQLRPMVDEDCVWTGELEVNIMTDKDNPLDKSSYISMMHLTEIVACSVAYMEQNPDLIEKIEDFIESTEYDEPEIIQKPEYEHLDGNVIKLKFGSKTKGNA